MDTLPVYSHAKGVLGEDFITPEEVAAARGIRYSQKQMARLAETIPSKHVLLWCRDNGYAIMPAPPTDSSLLLVRALNPELFYLRMGGWLSETHEAFAHEEKTTFGWFAMRKRLVPRSRHKSWNEQQKLLSGVEYVPNVAEAAWFITTFFLIRGIKLPPDGHGRVSSLSVGEHIIVRYWGEHRLHVHWSKRGRSSEGLLSARRLRPSWLKKIVL